MRRVIGLLSCPRLQFSSAVSAAHLVVGMVGECSGLWQLSGQSHFGCLQNSSFKADFFWAYGSSVNSWMPVKVQGTGRKNKKNKKIFRARKKLGYILLLLQLSLSFHHLLTLHSDTQILKFKCQIFLFLYYTAWTIPMLPTRYLCTPVCCLHKLHPIATGQVTSVGWGAWNQGGLHGGGCIWTGEGPRWGRICLNWDGRKDCPVRDNSMNLFIFQIKYCGEPSWC